MKKKYETLDEYLDDLDKIKERVAEKIEDFNPEQTAAYFAKARQRLEKSTGKTLRLRRVRRKSTASQL